VAFTLEVTGCGNARITTNATGVSITAPWPLHDIAIINVVWCMAYKGRVGDGAYVAQWACDSIAIGSVLQVGGWKEKDDRLPQYSFEVKQYRVEANAWMILLCSFFQTLVAFTLEVTDCGNATIATNTGVSFTTCIGTVADAVFTGVNATAVNKETLCLCIDDVVDAGEDAYNIYTYTCIYVYIYIYMYIYIYIYI